MIWLFEIFDDFFGVQGFYPCSRLGESVTVIGEEGQYLSRVKERGQNTGWI
jgi:hypothetical protein